MIDVALNGAGRVVYLEPDCKRPAIPAAAAPLLRYLRRPRIDGAVSGHSYGELLAPRIVAASHLTAYRYPALPEVSGNSPAEVMMDDISSVDAGCDYAEV